ncbi:MlaD family protein [Halopseudomonas phragmitis]|uniref:ABC transporter permease n=2 Tax=Pseudomonadaceae TaxID=135621 RepID=A0A1V0B464_9GAMM|nr:MULTISPECIES: MlaD family protein [Pseudomonadaceae]AQZ94718.1 ABC transporter permease [Halopseudomonas phragmitis]RHW22875.1 MCE family protein [Pseudomonas jilinensis]
METRAHHVLIGLFTLLAGAAGIFFAIWLSHSSTSREYNYYLVVFNEAVTGLSRGSSVQYSGIRIGDISELSLDPNDPRRVLARIRVGSEVPIKEDTRARLSFTGITGTSVIELSHGNPESPLLRGKNGQDPVIIATPSPISTLLANGEDLVTNINQLVANARTILSEENAASISRTLSSIDQATQAIAGQGDNLQILVSELTKISRQASETLNYTSNLMRDADTLLNEQGTRTLDNAEQALASIARTSGLLEELLSNNSEAFASGMQGLGQLEPAVNELRSSLNSLRNISRRLEDNPTRFLLGRDTMEEFEP